MISLSLLFNWIISEEVASMVVSLRMTNEPSTSFPLLLCQSITGLPHPTKLILQDNLMASPSTPSVDKLLVLVSQTGSDSEGIRRYNSICAEMMTLRLSCSIGSIHTYIRTYIHTYMHTCIHTCVCVCVRVCVCVCVCVCVYTYTYILICLLHRTS